MHIVYSFQENLAAHGTHIDAKESWSLWSVPGRGRLKLAQRTRPFTRFISPLLLPHSTNLLLPLPPSLSFLCPPPKNSSSTMRSTNSSTGPSRITSTQASPMVRSPSLLLPPSCFVPRMPDHSSRSAFRLFPHRVLHFSQDTSVRALSHFRFIRRPREHSNFPFSPLLQLQGALVSFSWIHVLVWDHDDHLYTLHYRYCPRLRADVPRYLHHN